MFINYQKRENSQKNSRHSTDRIMQSLLRWSIENSPAGAGTGSNNGDSSNGQHAQPRQIDPEIIDAILGKPESELMKEALAVAVDTEKNEDDRLQALDNFEMVRICVSLLMRLGADLSTIAYRAYR